MEEQYLAMSCDDEVDLICDEFERELAAGGTPQIDAFIQRGGPSRRAQLYSELMAILREYRNCFSAEENIAFAPNDLATETVRQLETHDVVQADDARAAAERSGVSIAHYELIEKIGAGCSGTVWRARDTHLDRT